MGEKMRSLGQKAAASFRQFMLGRYGSDKLNTAILCAALVCCLLSTLLGRLLGIARILLVIAAYGLMLWAVLRMLSRNTYGRYRENTKYLSFIKRLKDREHRYYACPKCSQTVRVPKGKGKVSITCPKCSAKFIKKT